MTSDDFVDAPRGVARHSAETIVDRWRALGARRSERRGSERGFATMRSREVDSDDGGSARASAMAIDNVVYEDEVFRKMHCELAWGDGGFEVLHVVMYPWCERATPVFAADVVSFAGRVTLCIADVAPVREDLTIPREFMDAIAPARERACGGIDGLAPRALPDWGREILGPLCVCVGPKVGDEGERQVERFVEYLFASHDAYVAAARDAPLASPSIQQETLRAQTRFCERQLENVKTRRALERAFGVELADRYMREVLFDVTPLTPCSP